MVDIQKMMEMLFKIYMMESMKEIKKDNSARQQVEGLKDFFKDNPFLKELPPALRRGPNSQEEKIIDRFLSKNPLEEGNIQPVKLSSEERDMILSSAKEASDYRCEVTKDGDLTITTHIWTGPDGVKKQMTIIDAGNMKPEDMKPESRLSAIKRLQFELAHAIDSEDYEQAASLRDAISDFKNK